MTVLESAHIYMATTSSLVQFSDSDIVSYVRLEQGCDILYLCLVVDNRP
jgi:hypothetical protein